MKVMNVNNRFMLQFVYATLSTRQIQTRSYDRLRIVCNNLRPGIQNNSLYQFSTDTQNTVSFTFIDAEGEAKKVTSKVGETLLDVAHENDIELEGACGGELACSTCHLVFEQKIFDELPEICEEEEDMLDLAWGLTDTSRLGCQIKVTPLLEGTTIKVPEESNNLL